MIEQAINKTRLVGRILEFEVTQGEWSRAPSLEVYRWLKGNSNHGLRIVDERGEITLRLNSDASGSPTVDLQLVFRATHIASLTFEELLVGHLVVDGRWISVSQIAVSEIIEDCPTDELRSLRLSEASVIRLLARYHARVAAGEQVGYRLEDEWSPSAGKSSFGTVVPKLLGDYEPREYQVSGFCWLSWLRRLEIGGLLGDPMGLGKTLQVLLLLKAEVDRGNGPNLVVCPTSLVVNWLREAQKFVGVRGEPYLAGNRIDAERELESGGFIVTTYEMVRRDELYLSKYTFNLLIADEAQYLKNSESQRAVAIRSLTAKCKIAVTGTPLENSIDDVWSVIDFVNPGILGTKNEFNATFGRSDKGPNQLAIATRPLLLRRDPSEVEDQLPTSVPIEVPIGLPKPLEELYLEIEATSMPVISLIGKLRQVTSYAVDCQGGPLSLEGGDGGKFDYLLTVVPEIVQRSEKLLIFAPFRRTISQVADFLLSDLGIGFVRIIDGSVDPNERQAIIDNFTEFDGAAALVLNPRAAGVGLNIQAANHVFHFSPEWNPAVVDQATARSLRKGQSRTVFVHHLFFVDTVEDVMYDRLATKRDLASVATPLTKDFADESEIRLVLSQIATRRANRRA